MKYTDQKFTEVVEILQSLEALPRRNDKRRAARTGVRLPIDVRSRTDQENWQKAELRDLSPRGISLVLPHHVESGLSFLVRFPAKPGRQNAPMICRVAHVDLQPDGKFLVGAEFTGRLNASESHATDADEEQRIRKMILD